jgi:carboxypeptidase family protein
MYTLAHMRFVALFWSAAAMFAQSSGTIAGTVLDLPGKPVAKAPVQARNVSTNELYRAASAETGRYTLAQLPPGVYEVSVNVPEFSAYVQPNVAVASAQTVSLDIHLIDFQFEPWETGANSKSTKPRRIPRPRDQRRALRMASRISPESGSRSGPLIPANRSLCRGWRRC